LSYVYVAFHDGSRCLYDGHIAAKSCKFIKNSRRFLTAHKGSSFFVLPAGSILPEDARKPFAWQGTPFVTGDSIPYQLTSSATEEHALHLTKRASRAISARSPVTIVTCDFLYIEEIFLGALVDP